MRYVQAPWYQDAKHFNVVPNNKPDLSAFDHIVSHLNGIIASDKHLASKAHHFKKLFGELAGVCEMVGMNDNLVAKYHISKVDIGSIVLNMSHYKQMGERVAKRLDYLRLMLLWFYPVKVDLNLFMNEWKAMFNSYSRNARHVVYPDIDW